MAKQSDQSFLRSLQGLGDPRKFTTENIKRSEHPDFATTAELQEMGFSGWRNNSLLNETELWAGGIKRGSVANVDNDEIMAEACQRLAETVFAL